MTLLSRFCLNEQINGCSRLVILQVEFIMFLLMIFPSPNSTHVSLEQRVVYPNTGNGIKSKIRKVNKLYNFFLHNMITYFLVYSQSGFIRNEYLTMYKVTLKSCFCIDSITRLRKNLRSCLAYDRSYRCSECYWWWVPYPCWSMIWRRGTPFLRAYRVYKYRYS